jgi:hypothetical protein
MAHAAAERKDGMSATRIALTVLVAALLSLSPAPAAADRGLPNGMVSIDRTVIGCQVRAAIALGEQARARLEGSGAGDDIAGTHKLLDTMYRQVRLALGNLKDRKGRVKAYDPMLDLEIAKVSLAWDTIRRPVDTFYNSKDGWVDVAERDLQRAMSALRQAEAMLPWCSSSRATRRDPDS